MIVGCSLEMDYVVPSNGSDGSYCIVCVELSASLFFLSVFRIYFSVGFRIARFVLCVFHIYCMYWSSCWLLIVLGCVLFVLIFRIDISYCFFHIDLCIDARIGLCVLIVLYREFSCWFCVLMIPNIILAVGFAFVCSCVCAPCWSSCWLSYRFLHWFVRFDLRIEFRYWFCVDWFRIVCFVMIVRIDCWIDYRIVCFELGFCIEFTCWLSSAVLVCDEHWLLFNGWSISLSLNWYPILGKRSTY